MKVPTIAAVIFRNGPADHNFQAAKAYLDAGGKWEVESSALTFPAPGPFDANEELDLSLLGLVQDKEGNWTNPE